MTAQFPPPLTPGRILYLLYHYPVGAARRSMRQGGPWQQWLDHRGRSGMQRAAEKLAPPDFGPGPSLELHQLTGRAYAFQSIFCLWSFSHAARRNIAPLFHDDGTLTKVQMESLRAVFPGSRIVSHDETWARVKTHLPSARFPALHERFLHYPLIRKLINIHLGSNGWKLVLDSDMLFFRRPDFLLTWLGNPRQPLYLLDVADAYGYPSRVLENLAGSPLPPRVNVGLCGLRSESIDWGKLEWWCACLLRREGSNYLLEQALTAMLLAGQTCAVAPAGDYITFPECAEVRAPSAVMHHYVDVSKRWYFRSAWRKALEMAAIS